MSATSRTREFLLVVIGFVFDKTIHGFETTRSRVGFASAIRTVVHIPPTLNRFEMLGTFLPTSSLGYHLMFFWELNM